MHRSFSALIARSSDHRCSDRESAKTNKSKRELGDGRRRNREGVSSCGLRSSRVRSFPAGLNLKGLVEHYVAQKASDIHSRPPPYQIVVVPNFPFRPPRPRSSPHSRLKSPKGGAVVEQAETLIFSLREHTQCDLYCFPFQATSILTGDA